MKTRKNVMWNVIIHSRETKSDEDNIMRLNYTFERLEIRVALTQRMRKLR